MSVHGADNKTRGNLVSKLSVLLEKVDKTLLSAQQELLLFKLAICPRLTWDLSVNHFPVSWLESTLQPITTKFLKRWSGLAKSADTGCLFLPKEKGGLEPPSDSVGCVPSSATTTPGPLQSVPPRPGGPRQPASLPGHCCSHAGGSRSNIEASA